MRFHRRLLLLFIPLLATLLLGCSNKTSGDPTPTPSAAQNSETPEPAMTKLAPTPAAEIATVTTVVSGKGIVGLVEFGDSLEKVKKTLGEPRKTGYISNDLYYPDRNLLVTMDGSGGGVKKILAFGPGYQTENGTQIGQPLGDLSKITRFSTWLGMADYVPLPESWGPWDNKRGIIYLTATTDLKPDTPITAIWWSKPGQ